MTDALVDRQDVSAFKFVRIADPNAAVGYALRFMMGLEAYAKLTFGEWARVIDGQVRRDHYGFVLDLSGQVVGFAGWALASEADADAWAAGQKTLTGDDCSVGDCLIFNAWIATSNEAHRFLLDAIRPIGISKKAAFFRRAYEDGTTRVVRLPITEAVGGHIARNKHNSSPSNLL